MAQIPIVGQQGLPLQKQGLSPRDLQAPYSSQPPTGQRAGPMQVHLPGGGPGSLTQSLPGQPVGSQLPTSQPFVQSLHMPATSQQQLTAPSAPLQLLQPSQMMLQQQAQSLPSTFHTTQQAFSQFQQQMQQMHPSQTSNQLVTSSISLSLCQ